MWLAGQLRSLRGARPPVGWHARRRHARARSPAPTGARPLRPPESHRPPRIGLNSHMVGILSRGQISRGNRSELDRRLKVLAKFRPLAARGSAQLLNLVL
jgi:hypothetical protein